jgi:addiction module HigA family antidote
MKDPRLANITAGEILNEEYLKPLGLTPYALAKALHVPAMRVSLILRGKRAITPDTAMRLGAFFKTSAQYWLNIQARCDLRAAEDEEEKILREIRPYTEVCQKCAA